MIPESGNYTEEEEEESLTLLPPSVSEDSEDSDINSNLIRQCDQYLKDFILNPKTKTSFALNTHIDR